VPNRIRRAARHSFLAALVALPALVSAAPELKLATPGDALTAMRKIQCSLKDGEVVTWAWNGFAYGHSPGEPDRLLFAVEGMNIRRCGPLNGATDGSFKMTTREILIYEDPKTREVLRSWDNPWTGKQVKVVHVSNDPVNQRIGATDRAGRPFELPLVVNAGQWWLTSTVPLNYRNPLGGEYQDYIGGKYQATEMFNFFGDVADLANPRLPSAPVRIGWVRYSGWLPWMAMGDRPGFIYFNTAGRKLARFENMSPSLLKELRANYPAYAEPPPLDDERPNETSWTWFKKVVPAGQ
jgi:hypothetical protein